MNRKATKINKHSKLSSKAAVPGRTAGNKGTSRADLIGLIRDHQAEIELHNKEIRRAMAEIIKEKGDQDSPISVDKLERTIQDRTAELTKAYELLNSLFASIDVHIAHLDTDFNFITVNQVYAAANKRAPAFYTGKNYFDLYPREENEEIFREVILVGEPYYEYEKPIVSADHLDRGVTYWDWSVMPVKGPEDTVSGLVLTMINVTDRKRAEENTIRLAAAIESAGDAVIITDVRGMIKYVNRAFEKITGYTKKEAVGRDKYILESGKQDEAFYRNVRQAIRREGAWTGRVVSKKKDGTLYEEECTWSVIRSASGEIINYVSIGRDITEKLRLEALARTAQSGSLSRGVRHEIGIHINAVINALGFVKARGDQLDKSDIERHVEGSLKESLKIDALLKTLKVQME